MSVKKVAGPFDPRSALEKALVSKDRSEALSALARDNTKLAALSRWCIEDPVAFTTACYRFAQTNPRLPAKAIASFISLVEQVAGGSRRWDGMEPVSLGDSLEHPAGAELLVPQGYILDISGLYAVDARKGKTLISHFPLVLEGYVRDPENPRAAMVVVAWRANGEWRRMVFPREVMGVSSDLARQSGQNGAPIHSSNASAVVTYLSAFEALNLSRFEEIQGISRMGWTTDMKAFLVGTTIVSEDKEEEIQAPHTLRDNWTTAERVFVPTGPEVLQTLAGYRRSGTLEGWKEAMDLAASHPLVLVGVYLALLPPLMQIVGAENLAFEWSGRSSVGKTSALYLSASVWGQPRLNLDPSIVSSWRVTDTFIERILATLGDLPMYLDDTRTVNTNPKRGGIDPTQVVYDVVAGTTKGRGTLGGTETKRAWRTVLLSTGEDPITGGSTRQGVYARTWAVTAWPWGETSPVTAIQVLRMESVLSEHYGHLGPLWVRKLMASRKVWPKWKEIYRELRDKYGTLGVAGDSGGVVGRLGKNLAAVEMVANIARVIVPEIFGELDFRPMIEELWRWAQREGAGADLALDALIYCRNQAAANQTKFYPRSKHQPTGCDWWGFWPLPTLANPMPHIFIRTELVLNWVKALNHANPYQIFAEWEQRKFIVPKKQLKIPKRQGNGIQSIRKVVSCGGIPMTCVEIVPPLENVEVLEAYERLAEQVEGAIDDETNPQEIAG